MWSMFKHPWLGVGCWKGLGCFNTWASAGVKRSVMCANVCVSQAVNAPQKNKVSFHQAPIIQLHHSSYIQGFYFPPKSIG